MPREGVSETNRLIIGVGGTGSKLVDFIAKTYKSLAAGTEAPRYISFMVIDSDKSNLDGLTSIDPDKKILIEPPPPHILRSVNPWLPEDLVYHGGVGAGNRRAFGKAMYNVYRKRILAAIRSEAERLSNYTGSDNFLVVIVGALGGGTGSALLPELAIDLRTMLINYYRQDPFMIGVGIVPGARESMIFQSNGYAALKELHFLINMEKEIRHGDRLYYNPFHMFILVSREVHGAKKDDEIREGLSRLLIDMGFIPSRKTQFKGRLLDLSDLLTRLKSFRNRFSTFGYYIVRLPVEEIEWIYSAMETREQAEKELGELEERHGMLMERYRGVLERREKLENAVKTFLSKATRLRDKPGIPEAMRRRLDEAVRRVHGVNEDLSGEFAKKIIDARRILDTVAARIERIRDLLERLGARLETIMEIVERSEPTKNKRILIISRDDMEKLRHMRGELRHMTMRDVMEKLGRLDEFILRTHRDLANVRIVLEPLANYDLVVSPSLRSEVLEKLLLHQLIDVDENRNPRFTEWKIGEVLALVSSHERNIIEKELAEANFKQQIENNIAHLAELLVVYVPTRRYTFSVYWLMIGLNLVDPTPGAPPKLRDLEWLEKAYNELSRGSWREMVKSHALLLGEPGALAAITGKRYTGLTPEQGLEFVMEFWYNYMVYEKESMTMSIAILLAETTAALAEARSLIQTLYSSIHEVAAGFRKAAEIMPGLGEEERLRIAEDLVSRLEALISAADSEKAASSYHELDTYKRHMEKILRSLEKIDASTRLGGEKIERMRRLFAETMDSIIETRLAAKKLAEKAEEMEKTIREATVAIEPLVPGAAALRLSTAREKALERIKNTASILVRAAEDILPEIETLINAIKGELY